MTCIQTFSQKNNYIDFICNTFFKKNSLASNILPGKITSQDIRLINLQNNISNLNNSENIIDVEFHLQSSFTS